MGALECSLQLTILVHGAQLALSRQRNLQTENGQIIGCGHSNPAIFADRPRPGSPASESQREKIKEFLPDPLADDAKTTDVLERHQALEFFNL